MKKIEKIDLNYRECYQLIYSWHITYGITKKLYIQENKSSTINQHIETINADGEDFEQQELDVFFLYEDWLDQGNNKQIESASAEAYVDLVKDLPIPNNANPECIEFVFHQVIFGLMEWAYGAKSGDNTLSDYAKRGLELLKLENNLNKPNILSSEISEFTKQSPLYDKFGKEGYQRYEKKRLKPCSICNDKNHLGHLFYIYPRRILKEFICSNCGSKEMKKTERSFWSIP